MTDQEARDDALTYPKLSSDWGRVVRSPIPERGQVIVMSREQFADGKDRIIVGYDVTPEQVTEMEAAIKLRDEADDRLRAKIDAINALMTKGPTA